ncbi:hypothetical protein CYLTODRAFT_144994 [Cylindrobasidium torrendii FP15055 ss-10]|uniref:Xylanolytic transcriptional activator regulatory domain-containing protein n=1 Tax=Cylindrobasidium torrendii FP15055 ss-10 TaxID=1314674 RepID=A0A0D7BL09_9AGAR|nr:hypothetical protein CYLTODRAFT_144994 [Cylindrobasidium torrendii FP15055 ss-10]
MSRKNGGLPVNLISFGAEAVREDLRTQMDSILSNSYTLPKDASVVTAFLKTLARYARQLELKLEDTERRINTPPTIPGESSAASSTVNEDKDATDAVHTMQAPMDRLRLSEPSTTFGSSQDVELIESTLSLNDEVTSAHKLRRPEFWYAPDHPWEYLDVSKPSSLIFPASDLLHDLVSLFFRHVHLYLIHEPTFTRQVTSGLHYRSHAFGSVVLAVCALAARHSDDPRVGSGHHKGWNYYTQLRAIHVGQYLRQENLLWDLQLMPLMGMYAYGLLLPDHCTMLTGMGILLSQSRGLHRLKRAENRPWTPEDEMLKRTFWFLVGLDVYVGSFDGKPRVTNYDEIDAEYPLEVDDEYWPGEMLADPDNPWQQPIDVPCRVSAFTEHLKLLEIYSFAEATIYSIQRAPFWDAIGCPEWGRNIVVELDSALNAWLDKLPQHLRWDPHTPTPSGLALYATYQWVCIQLHRPYLKEFASAAVCVTAARSCSHAVTAYTKASPHIPMPTVFGWAAFSSIILLLNLKNGKMASPRDLEDVSRNMELLARHEGDWQVAGRYHDIIREVYQLVRAPQEAENARKRKAHNDTFESQPETGPTDLDNFEIGLDADPTSLWDGLNVASWNGIDLNMYLQDLDAVWGGILTGSSAG